MEALAWLLVTVRRWWVLWVGVPDHQTNKLVSVFPVSIILQPRLLQHRLSKLVIVRMVFKKVENSASVIRRASRSEDRLATGCLLVFPGISKVVNDTSRVPVLQQLGVQPIIAHMLAILILQTAFPLARLVWFRGENVLPGPKLKMLCFTRKHHCSCRQRRSLLR